MKTEILTMERHVPGIDNDDLFIKDLFNEMRVQVEKIPCDRCGYIDCVCTLE